MYFAVIVIEVIVPLQKPIPLPIKNSMSQKDREL